MAGEQDILSLGLDISSFDTAKEKKLKSFISLFNDLSKFDGKIFNPVMGDGLTAFNKSIQETNKILVDLDTKLKSITSSNQTAAATANSLNNAQQNVNTTLNKTTATTANVVVAQKSLNTAYDILKRSVKDLEKEYANLLYLKGKDAAETKAALVNYRNAASVMNGLDKEISKAGGGAAGLTKNISAVWSGLLRVAYIVPGLGIAGLFNIAFDAIMEGVKALGLFNDGEIELLKTQTLLTESFNKQAKAMQDLYAEREKFFDKYLSTPYPLAGGVQTASDMEKDVEGKQARGYNQRTILAKELELAKKNYKNALEGLLQFADPKNEGSFIQGDLTKLKDEILNLSFAMGSSSNEIQILSEKIANKDTKGIGLTEDEAEQKIKLTEAVLNSQKIRYEQLSSILEKYTETERLLKLKELQIERFEADQKRKLQLETAKNSVSINIERNKSVLENDRKFHDEKESAIKANYEQEKKLASANLANVMDNLASENEDKIIAQQLYSNELEKAKIKRDKDLDKNDVEFYQRRLLALTEISKDEVEMEAIKNERIFLNDTKTLKERLDAYENYIVLRQKIKDLEYNLSIQKGASKLDGKTSLTEDEQKRVGVHRDTQQMNIQADAERRNYDITRTSLDKQIKETLDAANKEKKINYSAYAAELEATNERFKKRIFAYEGFRKTKEQIDKKYGVILSLEDEIAQGEDKIKTIKTLYEDLLKLKQDSDEQLAGAEGTLKIAEKRGGSTKDPQRFRDEALGQNKAITEALDEARKEIDSAEEANDKKRLEAAKRRYEQLIQFEREHAANRRAIMEGLWDLANTLAKGNLENEINVIERTTEARQQQSDLQKDAIEQSSLQQKDKAALEIQLTQQKIELDKAAQLEERKLRHEAAVKEREIAVAQVLWNTFVGVTSALKIPPPAGEALAIERGILGSIQLAGLLATPIPSYFDGTENHPGGYARFGENGQSEIVKIPGKKPFIADRETIADLPYGTKVIPIRDSNPEFEMRKKDESWEQTKYLAKQIKSTKNEVKNIIKPIIVVDMSFENRKRQILGN